jgi:hypothetical protein
MHASMVKSVTVMIAGPLQADLVEPIRAVDPRVEVAYEPDLLPLPRYPNDHGGVDDFRRTPAQARQRRQMLGVAEVLVGAVLARLAAALRENERIVSLFVENLRRYLRGEDLINRVDPQLLY